MANFCIPKEFTDKFVKALRAGKISPEQLQRMSSEERTSFLQDYLGGSSEKVSKMMETELLKKDMASYISDAEVEALTKMSKEIADTKAKITDDMPNGSPERIDYGLARALFQDAVGELKSSNRKAKYWLQNPKESFFAAAGAVKSVLTSLDNSFFGRQGLKTLFTNPDIWGKAFVKSWGDIGKELMGRDAMLAIKADVLSRQNALNGKYKDGKFAVGVASEEAYPSSLPEKIPGFGRAFKASESAFNGGALRIRADLADRIIEKADKQGLDTTDKTTLENLGKLVNSMTGRGDIGKLDTLSREINAAFFSIKFLKSNFDTLTAHRAGFGFHPGESRSFARAEAAKNLGKIVLGIGAVLTVANTLQPGSVETDPRSSDFGKIKIGNTRFDVTGGMSSLVTLATRLAPLLVFQKPKVKSTSTGKVEELNTGEYNSRTGLDLVEDFFEGKASPVGQVVLNHLAGEGFMGEEVNVQNDLKNLLVPMPIQDLVDQMNDPKAADVLLSMIAAGLGISITNYDKRKKKNQKK